MKAPLVLSQGASYAISCGHSKAFELRRYPQKHASSACANNLLLRKTWGLTS
jgi:hypothetical protein